MAWINHQIVLDNWHNLVVFHFLLQISSYKVDIIIMFSIALLIIKNILFIGLNNMIYFRGFLFLLMMVVSSSSLPLTANEQQRRLSTPYAVMRISIG